jgi:hypothetical protein
MSIDRASIFAERYRANPIALQQAVLGVGGQTVTDPYTALRALQLLKQSQAMQSAQAAQAPTNEPSIAAEAVTPQPNQPTPTGLNAGLGAMPVPTSNYAMGGMVAFADGGTPMQHYVERGLTDSNVSDEDAYYRRAERGDDLETAGTEEDAVRPLVGEGDPDIIKQGMYDLKNRPTVKFGDRLQDTKELAKAYAEAGGPDIYGPQLERLKAREGEGLKAKDQGLGLSLLKAAAAMSQGNNLGRGVAAAAGAFSDSYNEVLKQARVEQEHRDAMQFHLADAQRKDKLGQFSLAATATHQARMEAIAAQNAEDKRLALQVQLQALGNRGAKTPSAGRADAQRLEALTQELIQKGMDPVKAKAEAARYQIKESQNKNVFSVSDITGNKAAQGETGLDIKQQQVADQQKKLHGEELRKIKRSIDYLDANPATREQMVEAIDEKYPLAKHGKTTGKTTSGGNISLPSGFKEDQ